MQIHGLTSYSATTLFDLMRLRVSLGITPKRCNTALLAARVLIRSTVGLGVATASLRVATAVVLIRWGGSRGDGHDYIHLMRELVYVGSI